MKVNNIIGEQRGLPAAATMNGRAEETKPLRGWEGSASQRLRCFSQVNLFVFII
jgi:hypothetical protein